MNFLGALLGCLAAAGLIAAAFLYVVSPHAGSRLIKWALGAVLALAVGINLLGELAPTSFQSGLLWLAFLIFLSVVAHQIREARRRPREHETRRPRGAERTPLMPTHLGEEEL